MRDTFSRSPQDQHTLIQFPNHRAPFSRFSFGDHHVFVAARLSFVSIALPKSSWTDPSHHRRRT